MDEWASARLLAAALLIALAGCSADEPASLAGQPASISHVHGLGVDSSGTPYVATHTGLVTTGDDDGWVYASADATDHMGFTLHPESGTMWRSGHSAERPSLGVQSSTDGARWTHLADVADPPVDFHAMAVSFADAETLWGWDSGGRGTFRSRDGGRTWTRLEPQGIEPQILVLAGPPEEDVVLAGTLSGLHRSSDAGETWEPLGLTGGWVAAVAVHPEDARRIVAFTEGGMKVTDDGGDTWGDAGGGLPAGTQISALAFAPDGSGVAYAAGGSSIFRSEDGGRSWRLLDAA